MYRVVGREVTSMGGPGGLVHEGQDLGTASGGVSLQLCSKGEAADRLTLAKCQVAVFSAQTKIFLLLPSIVLFLGL